MDKEKIKVLSERLGQYKHLKETRSVQEISFLTEDRVYGVEHNPDYIEPLLDTMIRSIEVQVDNARYGGPSAQLENSREYKAAKQLEYAMNDFGFKPERFAQALPFFHKTLEQTFFRTVKACILAMAERDPRRIDDRNRASYEMCRMLAPMLGDTRLPFI